MRPGSQGAAALSGSAVRPGRPPGLLEKLIAAIRPEFRTDVLVFDPRAPVFGGPACAAGCRRPALRRRWRSQPGVVRPSSGPTGLGTGVGGSRVQGVGWRISMGHWGPVALARRQSPVSRVACIASASAT